MNLKSDIADELFTSILYQDDYSIKEIKNDLLHIKEIELKKDHRKFNKKKGLYTSIEFYSLENQVINETIVYLKKYLHELIFTKTKKKKPFILLVGIGNEDIASDALGPRVIKKIQATHHLEKHDYDLACLIPGVKGITGLDTRLVVRGINQVCHPDLVILIDALATSKLSRLNHCIQINDNGLEPGSGLFSYRKGINQHFLKVPVISMGVATVISLRNLLQKEDVDDLYFSSKEIDLIVDDLAYILASGLEQALSF